MENPEENQEEIDLFANLSDEALEYIEFLEEELEAAMERIESGRQSILSFTQILSFIKENFGETADFPVRIDSDFYREVFLKKLTECEDNITKFKNGTPIDILRENEF